jgi:hypothetical protein
MMMKFQMIKPYTQRAPQVYVSKHRPQRDWTVLSNLLADTDARLVAMFYNRHGLKPIPGLSRDGQIQRMLAHLTSHQLKQLEDELIAARYGDISTEALIQILMSNDGSGRQNHARMDQITASQATLLEQKGRRWNFTMRGHDVMLDVDRRRMACDCEFFAFAHARGKLCKHLATALGLIPESYAREVMIDLLVHREYGKHRPDWSFESKRAA